MKKTIYKTITLQEKIVHSMLMTLAILAVVYCMVLLSLVFSVIERKQSLSISKDLSSELSTLEQSYDNEVARISDTVIAEHGFVRVDNTTLAVRKDPIASYTVLYENR
jgi:hypothetical protein